MTNPSLMLAQNKVPNEIVDNQPTLLDERIKDVARVTELPIKLEGSSTKMRRNSQTNGKLFIILSYLFIYK